MKPVHYIILGSGNISDVYEAVRKAHSEGEIVVVQDAEDIMPTTVHPGSDTSISYVNPLPRQVEIKPSRAERRKAERDRKKGKKK